MQKIIFHVFCFLYLLLSSASPAQASSVITEFERLMELQCNIKEYGISTPMEARILRNVPYALAGHSFSSPELTMLFNKDGGWYKPEKKSPLNPRFEPCIRALEKHEKKLRVSVPMNKEVEEVFTRDPKVFLQLRSSPNATLRVINPGTEKNRTWSWSAKDPTACGGSGTPEEKNECSSLSITCELPPGTEDFNQLECLVTWAG